MSNDSITLKWGSIKEWHFETEECQELMRQWIELGHTGSAMFRHDTPEQKELICQIIDASDVEDVMLDWDGETVSKDEAKRYVMEYGKCTRRPT